MDPRRSLGRQAEAAAAVALTRAGLSVVARNVRFAEGEIDLVCRDGDVWVFVEVKCRQASWGDDPGAAVSWYKRRRLTRLALHYLKWRRLHDVRVRFDVVTVVAAGGTHGAAGSDLAVRHIRAAFDAVE